MIRPIVFAAVLAVAFPAVAEDMSVAVGQVATILSDSPPGTVVIGDPRVADVAVEGRTVMVFGKAAGETDLVVFDQNRDILFAHRIAVGVASGDSVTVLSPGAAGVITARWSCPNGRCVKETAR